MCIKARRLIGLLIVSVLASLVLSCGGSSRPAGLLLVISQGASNVTSYGIDLNTGTLTQINTAGSLPANTIPVAIKLDPAGSFAYVAGQSTSVNTPGSISAYSVASNGTLSSAGNNTATAVNPVALTIDQGGHLLFVANQGSDSVSVFSIGSNASLTAVPGSPFQLSPTVPGSAVAPSGVAVTPSAAYLYVSNSGESSVSGFTVDPGSGALISVGAPFSAGSSPVGLAIDPSGKYLYVANEGSNNVSAFEICATALPGCATLPPGSLVPVTGSPFSAGLGPISVVVDPSGNFLYVADTNSNQLSGYRINPSTGGLTALTTPTDSTGTNPTFVAVHPGGNFLYVPNSGSDSISGFRLTTQSGVLTPLATVSTASHPVSIALK
jgi:6-phosphogluconolactonase